MTKVLGLGKWLILIALAACSGISQGGDAIGGAGAGGSAGHADRISESGAAGVHTGDSGGAAGQPVAAAGQGGESVAEAGQPSEAGAGGEAGQPSQPPAPIIKLMLPEVLIAKDFPFVAVACANVGGYGATMGHQEMIPAVPVISGPCATPGLGFQFKTASLSADDAPDSAEMAGKLYTATSIRIDMWNSTQSGHLTVASDVAAIWIDKTPPVLSIHDAAGICGKTFSATGGSLPISLSVDSDSVVGTIQVFDDGTIVDTVTTGQATKTFTLSSGPSEISVSASDPAGNVGHLAAPCVATVN